MTKAFRRVVLDHLREAWRRYPPRLEVKEACKVKVYQPKKDGSIGKAYRVFWKCPQCLRLVIRTQLDIDHINAVGSAPGWPPDPDKNDWNKYLAALFCKKEDLQPLCKQCHKGKTKKDMKCIRNNKKDT